MSQTIRWLDKTCNCCNERVNSWDERISKALTYRYVNCEKCIAKEYDMDVEALRSLMESHFDIRPCLGL